MTKTEVKSNTDLNSILGRLGLHEELGPVHGLGVGVAIRGQNIFTWKTSPNDHRRRLIEALDPQVLENQPHLAVQFQENMSVGTRRQTFNVFSKNYSVSDDTTQKYVGNS